MEYYSAVKNNEMWFEGKWTQLEDITLSEVSQKHKSPMFSLIHERQIQDKHMHKSKHDHVQTQIGTRL
jgi:hypothetical protein